MAEGNMFGFGATAAILFGVSVDATLLTNNIRSDE